MSMRSFIAFRDSNKLKIEIVNLRQLQAGRIEAEFYAMHDDAESVFTGADVVAFSQYGTSDALNEEGHGYPVLRLNEYEGIFVGVPEKRCSLLTDSVYNSLKLKRNDVLICRTNGNPHYVGRSAIVMQDEEMAFASYLFRIRTNKEISPSTLVIFLNSKAGRKEIERYAIVSNQANFSPAKFRQISIPRFPLSIQELCDESVLAAYRKKLEANRKYQEAENLLLKEVGLAGIEFTNTNTSIRSSMEVSATARLDAEYWQPKYDEILEKIRDYKNGFAYIADLVEVSEKLEKINAEKSYGYVELADVDGSTGAIEGYATMLGKDLPSRARLKLKKDDVVVSTVEGSSDKVAMVGHDETNLLGSTGFFVFKEKYLQPEVILVLFKSPFMQAILKREAQGTILSAIPKTSLGRIPLPKLSHEVQEKIQKAVSESHAFRSESRQLIEHAKRAVEIFVEKDEKAALKFLG